MEELMKNIEKGVPLTLKDLVDYEPGKIASRTLAQRPGCGVTLMAFDAGEGISSHAAPGDAMAYVLEGTGEITVDGVPHTVTEGGAIVMPVNIPHAVKAVTRFKMLLVVVR